MTHIDKNLRPQKTNRSSTCFSDETTTKRTHTHTTDRMDLPNSTEVSTEAARTAGGPRNLHQIQGWSVSCLRIDEAYFLAIVKHASESTSGHMCKCLLLDSGRAACCLGAKHDAFLRPSCRKATGWRNSSKVFGCRICASQCDRMIYLGARMTI